MADNTVKLVRMLRAPAQRIYQAFVDPDAMVKWLPPHGFTGKVNSMDARVGGGYTMSFTNFNPGESFAFSVDIDPTSIKNETITAAAGSVSGFELIGSTVTVDIRMDGDRVADFAHVVKACALGQASSAIMAEHVVGATADEMREVRETMRRMLKENGPPPEGRFAEGGLAPKC